MKFTNTPAFKKHLSEAAPEHLSPIYLLISKDDFDRKEAEKILVDTLGKDALRIFDAEQAPIQEILSELLSLSFFVEKRVVLVRNADKFKKEAQEKLESYFESPTPSSYLILSAPAIHRGSKFYKSGEKAGIILDLPEEKPWEKEKNLVSKVMEWVKLEGKKMEMGVARLLIEHSGTDQSLLRNEIDKLLCYTANRDSITQQDIEAICTKVNTKNGWQLGDALFQRNGQEALAIATALLDEGSPFFALVRLIRSQFQTKLHICTILSEGGGPQEVQEKYPYMKGQILQNNVQQAKNYGKENLIKGILAIDQAELQAKSSSIDPELLTQHLILKLV